jgi:hypothetical protein
MQINFQISGIPDLKKKLESLTGKQMKSAMSMAINKTAAKGQSEITRAITERYQIKASEVRNSMSLRPSRTGTLEAEITIFGSTKKRGRSLNMIHFVEKKVTLAEARKRAKKGTLNQLRFSVIKGTGLKTIASDPALKNGAFIGNKGRTVFQRVGKGRTPIRAVQVIGVGQMFNFKPINARVKKKIEEEFAVEITRAVDGKLKGYL